MLIKRKTADVQRGRLQSAIAGLSSGVMDRRAFLRRSGLVAGGCAASGRWREGPARWPRLARKDFTIRSSSE